MIPINATIGTAKRFRTTPMTRRDCLSPCKAGPIEFTFFLKTDLPKSNADSDARFKIEIFPKMTLPNERNGYVIKCFFYGKV